MAFDDREWEKIYSSAKRPIDFFTDRIYYPFSLRLVYQLRNSAVTPNQLTITSLILGLISACFFARGVWASLIVGSLIYQASYILDCADGQLARYRKQYSPIGGWLDQIADRIKEFAVIYALALGYYRQEGDVAIWTFAFIAFFLVYLLEYYGQQHMTIPIGEEEHKAKDAADFNRFENSIYRLFPFRGFNIGEQTFVIALFTFFGQVRLLFLVMIAAGGLMAVYHPLRRYLKYLRNTGRNNS